MITRLFPLFLCLLLIVSCKKDDSPDGKLCGSVICENGTVCVNGTCDCTTGYSGVACETITPPVTVLLKKLTLIQFPATDTFDESWDPGGGPDLYFDVIVDNKVTYHHPGFKENANPSTNYEFLPNDLELTELSAAHRIALYDDDFQLDDFMGEVEFIPFDGKSFPEEITLVEEGGIAFRIELEYTF